MNGINIGSNPVQQSAFQQRSARMFSTPMPTDEIRMSETTALPRWMIRTVLLCHTGVSAVLSRMSNGSPLPMAQALSTPTHLRLTFSQKGCRRYAWSFTDEGLRQPAQLEMKFTLPKDEVFKIFISAALERLFQAIGILIEQFVFPSRLFVRRANSIVQASESVLRNGFA